MSEAAAAPGFNRWLSDERLTRRACGGDERAFAAIFRRYHQPLYRFCLAIVGNPEDAQDALQNTMVKVMRALPGEERQIELKPWLYRIAHNEAIDLLRRRRETRELDAEQAAPGYGLAEDAATRERLRRLLADLRELPERQREVLVMRELSGFEFEEIGAALGTSDAVARQTLYEARQSLRQMEEGREMSCDEVTRALSDGDGRVTRRRDVRAHLRSCAECRAFRDDIKSRQRDLAAISPLPAVAVAGIAQGLVGGSGAASGGGGLAAALGGGAAKTISASAAAKGVATVAAVAAVGVGAADRTGVIQLGLPGEGSSQPSQPAPSPAPPGGAGAGAVDDGKPAAGPGHNAGKQGAEGNRANADGPQGNGAAKGSGQIKPAPHERGQGGGHAYGKEKAETKTPGPPAEHTTGRDTEKQSNAASGQEKAAEKKPPERETGGSGKPEQAPVEKPPRPEQAPPSGSPPAQAKESPPNPQPAAAPEPPGQAPSQPGQPGKGAEHAAPGSAAGGGGPAAKP
ncbi:MAG TPA: sigma-70 family RNA polymerase sigma factor [Solirubrobacterales bacterium]|nr:sigma-70 family RNA polymerase sigma factor [Solirubrobacterales bacterium]